MLENAPVKTFRCTLKRLLLVSLVALTSLACFADIRTHLPARGRADSSVLPIDSRIGMVAQPDSSEHHIFLSDALSSEAYGYDWMQRYVSDASRDEISRSLGSWLSENLSVQGFLMSQALANADGSVSISIRLGDDVLCFVVGEVPSSDSPAPKDGSNDVLPLEDPSPSLAIVAARML